MTTIEPPTMTREEKQEQERLEKNAKNRASGAIRREKERLSRVAIPRTKARKHDTHARGITYVKDPQPTSTELKQYGVWRGDDILLPNTIPTGEPSPPLPKPATVYDGCGNDIATKWQRPITY